MYLEGHWMNRTGTEFIIVKEQVFEVPDRVESISRDAVYRVLFQMEQH